MLMLWCVGGNDGHSSAEYTESMLVLYCIVEILPELCNTNLVGQATGR